MNASWDFSIEAGKSNKDGQDSYLKLCVHLLPMKGLEGGPEIQNGFHLTVIPLCDLAHSIQNYAAVVKIFLDVLFPDWKMKLIGSLSDEDGNMTRHNSGLSTLLHNESLCKYTFCRIWCLSHQLELVVKILVENIDESGVFPFLKPFTETII